MDVVRIDSDDEERRFCVCVASYGYMGDLMRQSEKLRFLGPSRYNLAGAATLFKNRVSCTACVFRPMGWFPTSSAKALSLPHCPNPESR